MTEELCVESEKILKKLKKLDQFSSKFKVYPLEEVESSMEALQSLKSKIPLIDTSQNNEEVILSELQRTLDEEEFSFNNWLNGKPNDFETIKKIFNIPEEDINNLEPWLKKNKEKTIKTIAQLAKNSNVTEYELALRMDIPQIKRQAEEYVTAFITKYHQNLGKMLQNLTKSGEVFRDIEAKPTTSNRSYFSPLIKTLAIGIPEICIMKEDGTLQIKERELIEIWGHEGMGHALNEVITKASDLPYFLKMDNNFKSATSESVAQFYEKRIFEDIKNSQEVQKSLGIEHKFAEIYQEMLDINLIKKYQSFLFHYAITILANKELGKHDDPKTIKERIRLISEVALSPSYGQSIVYANSHAYDHNGNFSSATTKELIYCAQPIKRALEEFEKQGLIYEKNRNLIDLTFLTGFWTPEGFVDNARITTKEYKEKQN